MISNKRFAKNYDSTKLTLKADQRGFIVGQSRLGVTKLRTTLGTQVDILGGFTSVSINQTMQIVDGAWLEPNVSTLTLTTKAQSAFLTYDGEQVTLAYDGVTVFSGFITESALSSSLDDAGDEEFAVTLQAVGYEAVRANLPAKGTASTYFNLNGAVTPVIQWASGKLRDRATDISGLPVVAEDAWANVQLEEKIGVENDVTGTQAGLLGHLAIRAGLLLDLSDGKSVRFRSYQLSPLWCLADSHIVNGYSVSVDRDSPGGLVVTRKEDESYVRAYRAGSGSNPAEVSISTPFADEWQMASVAAYAPLIASPRVFLASASIPRSDDLPLTARLPIRAVFNHGNSRYTGTIVGLRHSITPERWMMDADIVASALTSRVGDLAPRAPRAVAASVAGTTATLTWAGNRAADATGTPLSNSYFIAAQAQADGLLVGDELQIYNSSGVLKEARVFSVKSKSAPFLGFVNVTLDPTPASLIVAGDYLGWADGAPTPNSWVVWYQQVSGTDNQAINPNVLGFTAQSVQVFSPTAVIPGLTAASTYRFTVYALSATPNVRSGPSLMTTVTT